MSQDIPFASPSANVTLMGSCHCGGAAWTLVSTGGGELSSATACNCTLCRRYGALWAYSHENQGITITGNTKAYSRIGKQDPALEVHFCPTCGCVVCWRGLRLNDEGQRRMAVNLRLAEPSSIATLPIDHFDGLDTFDDLPRDGKCIRDIWF